VLWVAGEMTLAVRCGGGDRSSTRVADAGGLMLNWAGSVPLLSSGSIEWPSHVAVVRKQSALTLIISSICLVCGEIKRVQPLQAIDRLFVEPPVSADQEDRQPGQIVSKRHRRLEIRSSGQTFSAAINYTPTV
jgi:hypothetical protein